MKEKLSGVFVPTITPFEDDKIQYEQLEENLKKLNSTPITGHLALGSNGEYKSLTRDEQLKVLEIFVKNKGDKIIMAGTGCESTRETVELSKQAQEIGADFVSVLTPSYFKKIINDQVLINYYTEIADNVDIPVLIYNAPGFTGGVTISPKAVRKLSDHPNIVGMKDSSKAGLMGYLSATRDVDDFYVLAGSMSFFLTGLIFGAVGGIISLANAIPQVCCQLYQLFIDGKLDQAKDLHMELFQINGRVSGANAVAGVKSAATICGYNGGDPRRPLIPLTEEQKQQMNKFFEQKGLI
ncbi:MAG: dihydrodipicolinate synthase family protein [Actinomycetia bacterium]|nr:dihydrodipicolinate synthase family protein [Actinomycetes bacterium]